MAAAPLCRPHQPAPDPGRRPGPVGPVSQALTTARAAMGAPQMAFVRAWAEGLDALSAWRRYLAGDGAADLRLARAELQRLLDVLRGLAQAHGRDDLAVLLRRDPEAMAAPAGADLSLDDFIAQQPPDFYSEAELVAMYQVAHGGLDARSAARRRQRLRARLLDALHWLQRQAVRAPQADDLVAAWLDARVASRLAAAGLTTLGALHRQVCVQGYHWHRRVPRLGPRGAARVLLWLGSQAQTLGPLPASALRPPRSLDHATLAPAPALGIVPLDRLALPASLDGRAGTNRGPRPAGALGRHSDVAALQDWLSRWPANGHTWRAYRREAERLLLWAVLVRDKPLAALDAADCALYRSFVLAPGAPWCAPRHTQRWSAAWRPFEAGLSSRSADTALAIVRALCAWLVRQGHLAHDPWAAPAAGALTGPAFERCAVSRAQPAAAGPARTTPTGAALPGSTSGTRRRALSLRQWQLVLAWLAAQPPSPARQRLSCALRLGAETGLRLSTLCAARSDWLLPLQGPQGRRVWHLRVAAGASGKPGPAVALSDALCRALRQHLDTRGGNPVASAPVGLAHCADAAQTDPTNAASLLQQTGVAHEPRSDDPLLTWAAAEPPVALIGRLPDGAALSPARLYTVLRTGFARCAASLAAQPGDGGALRGHGGHGSHGGEDSAGRDGELEALGRASSSWLRAIPGMRAPDQGRRP